MLPLPGQPGSSAGGAGSAATGTRGCPHLAGFPLLSPPCWPGDTTQGHVGAAMEHSAQELLNTIIFLMIAHKLPGLGCHPPAKEHGASLRATLPSISHQQSHSHAKSSFLADEGTGLFFTCYFFQHLALPQALQGSAIPVAQSCEPSQSGDVSLNASVQFSLYLRCFV